MRKISPRQYALSLYESLAESKDHVNIMENFLALVSYNKDWKNLSKIISSFETIYNEKEGLIEAKVESVRELSNSLKKQIITWLKERENKEIILKEKINQNLLGGFKISYQDTVVDASLKTQLQNLQNILNN